MENLNLYGDQRTPTISGHGVDIASQRMDDLDEASIDFIKDFREKTGLSPVAFDLGCGLGAHSVRMAQAGASVIAIDLDNNREDVLKRASSAGLASQVSFVQMDIRKGLSPIQKKVDVVYSQRTLHYLTFEEAVNVLSVLKAKARNEVWTFVSASGINSELGDDYEHKHVELSKRYAELSPEMVEKHAINGRVCLYDQDDIERLLVTAGMIPIRIYASPFGNIKAIARS